MGRILTFFVINPNKEYNINVRKTHKIIYKTLSTLYHLFVINYAIYQCELHTA